MTPEQLDRFEQLLLDLQDSLLGVADLPHDAAATVELDQTRVGRLSRMDALQGQAMALASNVRREVTLLEITRALERLDDESYGVCLECDQDILLARLEIDPAAMYCVNCAALKE